MYWIIRAKLQNFLGQLKHINSGNQFNSVKTNQFWKQYYNPNQTKPNDLKGRPIVVGPDSPTQTLSSLKILKPIATCLTKYVKDDFIKGILQNNSQEPQTMKQPYIRVM